MPMFIRRGLKIFRCSMIVDVAKYNTVFGAPRIVIRYSRPEIAPFTTAHTIEYCSEETREADYEYMTKIVRQYRARQHRPDFE